MGSLSLLDTSFSNTYAYHRETRGRSYRAIHILWHARSSNIDNALSHPDWGTSVSLASDLFFGEWEAVEQRRRSAACLLLGGLEVWEPLYRIICASDIPSIHKPSYLVLQWIPASPTGIWYLNYALSSTLFYSMIWERVLLVRRSLIT